MIIKIIERVQRRLGIESQKETKSIDDQIQKSMNNDTIKQGNTEETITHSRVVGSLCSPFRKQFSGINVVSYGPIFNMSYKIFFFFIIDI